MKLKNYFRTIWVVLFLLLMGQSSAQARAFCLSSIANYTDKHIAYWGIEPYEDFWDKIKLQTRPHSFFVDMRCRDAYMGVNQARLSVNTDYSGTEVTEFVRFASRIGQAETKKQFLMSDDNECQYLGGGGCNQRYTLIYDLNNTGAYPDCWIDHHFLHKSVIHVKASVYQCTKPTGHLEYRVHFSCVTKADRSAAESRGFNSITLSPSTAGC